MTAVSVYHWSEAELKLIAAVKENQIICSPLFRGSKIEIGQIWAKISEEINVPATRCRSRWSRIKTRYLKLLSNTQPQPLRTKYLDGRLSFLDVYYNKQNISQGLTPTKAVHDVVVIESDEDLHDEKDYMIDLEIIDNLLEKRGSHEDIEMARMEAMLSLVYKRIEETLAQQNDTEQLNQTQQNVTEMNKIQQNVTELNQTQQNVTELNQTQQNVTELTQTQQNVTEPQMPASTSEKSVTSSQQHVEINTPADIIELDDGECSDDTSDSQSSQGEDMEKETSENLQHAVRAFPTPSQAKPANVETSSRIPIASMSIPMAEKPNPETIDEMETIFDIHRRSDSKTFFQELGHYLERFSKQKQDVIRLKICCLVTEVELEEID